MRQADEQSGWAKRRGRTAAVVALTVAVIVPVTAYAADGFNDVPDSNVFHDDIDWMRDNGVTAGCNPPANDEYCPDETVTREQMAAFMHRLESRGVFLKADGKAVDADMLDGKDGTYYANPIAIASGSAFSDSGITSDGEVARLTLSAPAAGDVIARLTSSWDDNSNDYTIVMWIEPHDSGSECDSRVDEDAVPGTWSIATVYEEGATGFSTASMAGTGVDAGVSGGSHDYSVCVDTAQGSGFNIDWSGSVEWRAAGTSTSALTSGATGSVPANRDGVLSRD